MKFEKSRIIDLLVNLLHRRSSILILSFVFFSRFLLWLFQSDAAGDDGERYFLEGLNWAKYGVFSSLTSEGGQLPLPTAHDLPIFPGLIAVLMKVFPDKTLVVHAVGLVNILFFLGFVINVMLCAHLLFKEPRAVLVAGVLCSTFPELLIYSLFCMPESLYLLLSSFATFLLVYSIIERQPATMIVAVVAQSLAVLTKPIGLPYLLLMVVVYLFFSSAGLANRCFIGIVSLMAAVIVLSPWCVRNYYTLGSFGLTTIAGTNLYDCNYRYMLEDMQPEKRQRIQEQHALQTTSANSCDLMMRSKILGKIAKKEILENPCDYAWTMVKRHPRLYVGTGTVALLRYVGYWRPQNDSDMLHMFVKFGIPEIIQIVSWFLLGGGYCLCGYGLLKMVSDSFLSLLAGEWISVPNFMAVLLCGGLVLFATVIGPVVATRYRVAMDMFIILAAARGFQNPKR